MQNFDVLISSCDLFKIEKEKVIKSNRSTQTLKAVNDHVGF